MRLDVGEAHVLGLRQGRQGADLVEHVVAHHVDRESHGDAAEAAQIPVAGVRSDGGAGFAGGAHRPADARGIAGVEAAGHVGGAHQPEQGGIVAQLPAPERLAEVAVQVDGHGLHATGSRGRAGRCVGRAATRRSRVCIGWGSMNEVSLGPVVLSGPRFGVALALIALLVTAEILERRGRKGLAPIAWNAVVLGLLAARLGYVGAAPGQLMRGRR